MERELQKIVDEYQNQTENISWQKAAKDIAALKNRLYFIFLEFLDKLQIALHDLPIADDPTLRFTYEQKPQIPLTQIVATIMPRFPLPVRISEEKGSFIEVIQFCSAALPYVKTFLELMGIVVPIALAVRSERREERKEKEKEKEQEPSERDQSIISLPNVYISPGITSTTGTQVAQVTKVIIEFNLLSDGGKRGYSAKNLKTIKLVPSVKVTQNT